MRQELIKLRHTRTLQEFVRYALMAVVVLALVMIGVFSSSRTTHADVAATTTATSTTSTASSTSPNISSLMATSSDTNALITWNTDLPANSQVAFGTTTPYSTFSGIDSTNVTSHSVQLTDLLPGTLYHYQAISQIASGTPVLSVDQTFTTMNASTTGTSTVATSTSSASLPIISQVLVNPIDTSATITWTTDQLASSQVMFGNTATYNASSTLDTGAVMTHTVTITGLSPSTLYHFQVLSGNSAGVASSSDDTFMTAAASTTGGGSTATTTPDNSSLQDQITALQNRVSALEAALASLGSGGGGTSTTPTTSGSGPATIDQNGGTYSPSGVIDFSGRNFGHEETVMITNGNSAVATAHADGGGNFSTGSIMLPPSPGTYTYTFVGQTSGIQATATITIR